AERATLEPLPASRVVSARELARRATASSIVRRRASSGRRSQCLQRCSARKTTTARALLQSAATRRSARGSAAYWVEGLAKSRHRDRPSHRLHRARPILTAPGGAGDVTHQILARIVVGLG